MENYIIILTPIILALFAGIGWLYKHEREKRVIIEKQLSEKKYNVYMKFINLYFQIYENIKLNKNITEREMISNMISIKKDLIVYGSDKVIEKFFLFEQISAANGQVLHSITDIIIEMRRDMGFPKTKITVDKFLRSLVRDEKDYQELKGNGIL